MPNYSDRDKIYLLDNKLTREEIRELITANTPFTQNQIIEEIISKVDENDQSAYEIYLSKYNLLEFELKSDEEKLKQYYEDLCNLEKNNRYLKSWTDPTQWKSDLHDCVYCSLFSEFEDYTVLWNYQMDKYVKNSLGNICLTKIKQYLLTQHKKYQKLIDVANSLKGLPPIEEDPVFDEIECIKGVFKYYEDMGQIKNFISNMAGKRTLHENFKYIIYHGAKKDLWKCLNKIKMEKKYYYKDIAYALSTHCKWQRTPGSLILEFSYEDAIKGVFRKTP